MAVELGASAIGFIFWPRSPRFIEPAAARDIVAALPSSVLTVGVFVDQSVEQVARTGEIVGLGAVQLHGNEDPAEFIGLPQRVIKAIGMTDDFDPAAVDALPAPVTVLVDAHDPVRRGGTGRRVDWRIAADVARRRDIFLSGGITPANIDKAIEQVKPFGIDVASGVESTPGIKDEQKLRALFAAISR
jgi:phosphoribosylanthranilate isomerase